MPSQKPSGGVSSTNSPLSVRQPTNIIMDARINAMGTILFIPFNSFQRINKKGAVKHPFCSFTFDYLTSNFCTVDFPSTSNCRKYIPEFRLRERTSIVILPPSCFSSKTFFPSILKSVIMISSSTSNAAT